MSPKISDKIKALESDYLFEKEVKISELKQEKQTLFYYIIFSLLILVISLISMLWIIQKQKSQKLKQKQVILKIEREELKKDIYNKEKTIISNTLHIVEKNELISQVTEKIELAIQKLDAPSKKKILNIIKELNSSKNAKLWEEFELRFVDVHKDFYNHLQESHPDLTPNERRLCAFLKLNMSTKEISSITLQSQESIEKARTRLRKKFNLTNTNTNLVSFLSQY
jgi:DNA-binding CsgD family transcriptional regulator